MAQSKFEKLIKLSPLATAIAFSSTQAVAEDFVITSQDDLDDAIEHINNKDEGSHSITFDSTLSGASLSMDGIYLDDFGSITVDGIDAPDLTLRVQEKNNYYGFDVEDYAQVTLKNVNIFQGANADDEGSLIEASEYSEVLIDKVNFTGLIGDGSEEVFDFDESDLVITNATFAGMSASKFIHWNVDEENPSDFVESTNLEVINTTFEDIFTDESGFFVTNYGSSNDEEANVIFDRVSVSNSEIGDQLLEVGGYASNFHDTEFNVSITNSSFTHNEVGDEIFDFGFDTYSYSASNYDSTFNLNVANVTISNNDLMDDGAVLIDAYGNAPDPEYYGTFAFNVNFNHVTLVDNTSPTDEEIYEEGEGVYGGGLSIISEYYEEATQYIDTDLVLNVSVANSIIAGHEVAEAELEVDAKLAKVTNNNGLIVERSGGDFYTNVTRDLNGKDEEGEELSNTRIVLDNNLIGAEYFTSEQIEAADPDDPESRIRGKNIDGDPMLEELADNGGVGMTRMPMKDSPAVDAASIEETEEMAEVLGIDLEEEDLVDQRGAKRVKGDAADLGAVERGSKVPGSGGGSSGSLGFGALLAVLGLSSLRRRKR